MRTMGDTPFDLRRTALLPQQLRQHQTSYNKQSILTAT
jgi:hypothetical protein